MNSDTHYSRRPSDWRKLLTVHHCASSRPTFYKEEIDKQHKARESDRQGPDFDDMSFIFPCEIDDAIQYINLGYGAQAPKIVIL